LRYLPGSAILVGVAQGGPSFERNGLRESTCRLSAPAHQGAKCPSKAPTAMQQSRG